MERPFKADLLELVQRAKQVLGYGRHLARLASPRKFRAQMLTGQLPGGETTVKVLYLGHTEYISPVRDYFFDGKYQAEDLGPAPSFFQNSACVRLLKADTDAVVTACLPGTKNREPSAYEMTTLRAVVHLPETMEEFRAGLPRTMRWPARSEFETELGTTSEDYSEFYERMLKPLMIGRHGPKANIVPLNHLLRQIGYTSLIFVKHQGRRLGGCLLCWPRMVGIHAIPHGDKIGIVREMSHDSKLLNKVNLAIYHSLYRLAWERGFRAVSLGTVSPILNSGLVRFKARWGATFHAGSHDFDYYRHSLSFCSDKRHAIQSCRHLVHVEDENLVATVGVREENSIDTQADERQKDGHIHNLSKLYRIYTNGRVDVLAAG
jgi:hypothetical protein